MVTCEIDGFSLFFLFVGRAPDSTSSLLFSDNWRKISCWAIPKERRRREVDLSHMPCRILLLAWEGFPAPPPPRRRHGDFTNGATIGLLYYQLIRFRDFLKLALENCLKHRMGFEDGWKRSAPTEKGISTQGNGLPGSTIKRKSKFVFF